MLQLIAFVALIGLFDWAIQTVVPLTEPFKRIVHVIAVVAAVVLVLNFSGLVHIPAGI